MSAKGFYAAQEGHFVNALPPVDISSGKFSDVWSMRKHEHCTIVVQVGVSAAAWTKIIVNATDDFVPTTRQAIPYTLFSQETAAGDVLAAKEAVLAAGKTPSANDSIFYVIEIDASELPDGKPNLEVSLTNGVNSVIGSVLAILSGARYEDDQSPTVVA
jgi:hypothetical protein